MGGRVSGVKVIRVGGLGCWRGDPWSVDLPLAAPGQLGQCGLGEQLSGWRQEGGWNGWPVTRRLEPLGQFKGRVKVTIICSPDHRKTLVLTKVPTVICSMHLDGLYLKTIYESPVQYCHGLGFVV